MELDDFVKYSKEKFGVEVSVKESEDPDTFDKIFGDIVEDNRLEDGKYYLYQNDTIYGKVSKNK